MFALMVHYTFIVLCLGLLCYINAQNKGKLCAPGWYSSGVPCMDCARTITEDFTKTMCLRAGHHIVRTGVMDTVDHPLMICCQAWLQRKQRSPRAVTRKMTSNRNDNKKNSNVSTFAFGNPAMPRNPHKKKKKDPSDKVMFI